MRSAKLCTQWYLFDTYCCAQWNLMSVLGDYLLENLIRTSARSTMPLFVYRRATPTLLSSA